MPEGLKEFYRDIGYGWWGVEGREDVRNLIVHPLDAVDLYKGISEFTPPEKFFLPGDLPFFDCGSGRFLVMRPQSNDPEAVYRDDGIPLASSMSDFMEKLLGNPIFYERPAQ
jgi:hypothetical protein